LASTFHPFFNRFFSERRWEEVAEHAWAEGTAWEMCVEGRQLLKLTLKNRVWLHG
jgi:hypothetical protein